MEIVDDSDYIDLEPIGLGCSLEKFTELNEVLLLIDNIRNYSESCKFEKEYERFRYIINLYKEQPHLINPFLSEMLTKIIDHVKNGELSMNLKHEAFKYMFLVTNVAGYKVVVQYLPHSAGDLEPVLQMLETQDKKDTATWETRYCLILWLSIIVKIPFHLSRLDYSEGPDHKTIAKRIIELCKQYLVLRDSCRIATAILCAHFFTRSDIKDSHLKAFLDWGCQTISIKSPDIDNIGILGAFAAIMKLGKREDVLPYTTDLIKHLISINWKKEPFRLSRKFTIKVIQRIGLAFLKPRVLSWRYQRGCRSITENLAKINSIVEESKVVSSIDREDEEDEGIDVPEEIEEVIEELIEALKDADLTVRWCGAKGVGRVAGRLNQQLADEVVGSVLELLSPSHTENAWHGGCLALAELSKRGLLLPSRLPEVMPLVKRALTFDEPRGFASVGAIVRDAACYVAWAFARAYETHVFKPYVHDLANSLVIVACFDREINIRRAASAAFQEHIGRQGSFPHGIEILTSADYFTVAVRQNSYLNISVFIAQFKEYSTSLIDHLVERKIEHWDVAVRELSSKALHNLTSKSPEYMWEIVLPTLLQKTSSIDVNTRHGAVLSIGEIVHALSILNMDLDPVVESTIRDLVKTFKDRQQFRGMNGELMKSCCCHLVYKCSVSKLKFDHLPVIDEWQGLLDECLCHEVIALRSKASLALSAMSNQYYKTNEQLSRSLVEKYTGKLEAKEELVRLGNTLALGSLPSDILKDSIDEVVCGLIKCSRITPGSEKWVESRKEAIKAITAAAETLGFEESGFLKHMEDIVECLICGLQDYTVDDRGDTGAWVREASLAALKVILIGGASIVTKSQTERALCLIAEQAVQRIDRTRFLATRVFITLIHSSLPHVPNRSKLFEIFPEDNVQPDSWSTSYEMLNRFVLLMPIPVFSYHLLQGFIISIGGLTESLVKNSSKAFFSWLSSQELEEQQRITNLIITIYENNLNDDRIIQPMANFIELLLSNGCISSVMKSETNNFAAEILRLVKLSFSNSTMKYKLIGSINIYCQLIQVEGAVGKQAVSRLMVLLCHKLGWVRRSTASTLYESLLIYGDLICTDESVNEALNLLSDTDWPVTSVVELRPIRNRIAVALGVKPPVLITKND